jgi:hypothetical protein
MADDLLAAMREVRSRAEVLGRTLVEDYQPFMNPIDNVTFYRLPSNPPKGPNDIGVTPTCTAFMTLALTGALSSFYGRISEDALHTKVKDAIKSLMESPWQTGRLEQNNAFTTVLMLRAGGMLFKAGFLKAADTRALKRKNRNKAGAPKFRQLNGKSFRQMMALICQGSPESIGVEQYPPTPSISYWLLDAIALFDFTLSKEAAEKITRWASNELVRGVSLVTANHTAKMDPVAMAMAACLCKLLRRIAAKQQDVREHLSAGFPTDIELDSAVQLFFEHQNTAGVWEKYSPLFHYPGSGPNHCWHFEVLEAILQEFPESVRDRDLLKRVDHSLTWLESNRLDWRGGDKLFSGWNAGSDLRALQNGEPESWPTGVAHMFLHRLQAALSVQIQDLVLQKYRERVQRSREPSLESWESYLNCDLPPLEGPRATVKGLLNVEVLGPAEKAVKKHRQSIACRGGGRIGPGFRLEERRSALLFGPPGTSKTSLAEAVAQRLGWTFIELSPSDFLKGGLEGIYNRVNDVFNDLMDLFGAVILFDEMDALVQSREPGEAAPRELDVTQRFLTTSMLPKLLQLRKQARTIFFMATNHQKDFDPAIKRSGRFDLMIRMGPPGYNEKLRALTYNPKRSYWYKKHESEADRNQFKERFAEFTDSSPMKEALALFTYGEMDALFDLIRRKDSRTGNVRVGLEKLGKAKLEDIITIWRKHEITLCDGSAALEEYEGEDLKAIKIQ